MAVSTLATNSEKPLNCAGVEFGAMIPHAIVDRKDAISLIE